MNAVSKRREMMVRWLALVCWIIFPILAFGQSKTGGSGTSVLACAGGPPVYCGRNDLAPQTINNVVFGPTGGTGTPFVDPDFGSRMVRVSDANTDSLAGIGCCLGHSSAEANEWGLYDSTLFGGDGGYRFYLFDLGSGSLFFGLDAKTMAVAPFTYNTPNSNLDQPVGGNPNGLDTTNRAKTGLSHWSHVQPQVVYGVLSTYEVMKYDFNRDRFCTSAETGTTSCTSTSATAYVDFSDCPNLPTITGTYETSATASNDDRYLSLAFGGTQQNNTILEAQWDTQTGNCYWHDTLHGVAGGTGMSNTPTPNSQLAAPGAFTISASAGGSTSYCAELTFLVAVRNQSGGSPATPTTGSSTGETLPSPEACTTGSPSATITVNLPAYNNPSLFGAPGCNVQTGVSPCQAVRLYLASDPSNARGKEQMQNSGTGYNYTAGISIAASSIVKVPMPYTVTGASWTSGGLGTATLTIGTHSLVVGQVVAISGVNPAGYNNGGVPVVVTGETSTTITYALASNPGAYVSGGLVAGAAPPSTATAGYNIHQDAATHDDKYLNAATGAGSNHLFWQPGTTNVIACAANLCASGHSVNGFTTFVNAPNSAPGMGYPSPFSLLVRPVTNPGGQSLVGGVSTYPCSPGPANCSSTVGSDGHISWNDDSSTDTYPIEAVWYNSVILVADGSTTTYSSSCINAPNPWLGEVVTMAMNGSGLKWRFAHHRASACPNPTNNGNEFNHEPIGNINQDGKFMLVHSDWGWQLGTYYYPSWAASHSYPAGSVLSDSNRKYEVATTGGTSCSSAPTWPVTAGGTVTESCSGGPTWEMNLGCADSAHMPANASEYCRTDVFVVELK
jgi:hypothetical protein